MPSVLAENIVPGLKEIRDDPEIAASITPGAMAKEIPGAVVSVAKSFPLGAIRGATELPNIATAGHYQPKIKFNVPFLGEVTNSDYRIAQRIEQGEDALPVIMMEKSVGLLDALFFGSLLRAPFAPRTDVVMRMPGPIPGATVTRGPQSFRMYTPPQRIQPLRPEQVTALYNQGVPLKTTFDPKLPTFFRIKGTSGGKVVAEVVQIRPSFVDTFMQKFGGDPTRVPPTELISLGSVERGMAEVRAGNPPPTIVPVVPKPAPAPTTPTVRPTAPAPTTPTVRPTAPVAPTVQPPIAETPLSPVSPEISTPGLPTLPPNAATGFVSEFLKASGQTLDQLRSQVGEVTYGEPGTLEFTHNGQKYTAPEPADILPVGNDDASHSWALKQLIQGNTTPKFSPYGPNDVVMLTDKTTGRTAERTVVRVDGNVIVVRDSVSGIPYKASLDRFDVRMVKQGDPNAPLPKTGITFGELAAQEAAAEAAKGTQKQQVAGTIKETPKSIREIAKETGIKEPNVRRILGVGAKEGTFTRVDKGVYVISKDGMDLAYIEVGDALESLPRLAEEGFKADMVFLDIPYKTPAITGGNRGMNYNLITPEEFGKVLDSVKIIAQTPNAPVIHMFSQAPSGMAAMQKYNDKFIEKGFIPVGRGELQKTFKTGAPVTNVRGEVSKPEGIIVFTQSGKLDKDLKNLNFKLVRPTGYQSEKPAEMLNQMIEMTTNEGDVVLDPFAGSGVTGAEAVKLGRKPYLIEKDKKVAEEITKPRVEGAVKGLPAKPEAPKKEGERRVLTEVDVAIPEKNQYYVSNDKGGLSPVKGKPVSVDPRVNTFIYGNKKDGYTITELSSGRSFGSSKPTEEGAIASAKENIAKSKNFMELVEESAKKFTPPYPEYIADKIKLQPKEVKAPTFMPAKPGTLAIRPTAPAKEVKIRNITYTPPKPLVTKSDIKILLEDAPGGELEFTVANINGQLRMEHTSPTGKMSLRPSALGLVEDNLTTGQKITISAEDLKAPGTAFRGINSEGGVDASAGGKQIDTFENQIGEPLAKGEKPDFKLYEKVNGLIKKYAKRVGEGYLPKGTAGVFYHGTENIRLKGMNELSVAAHEITHSLDLANAISKRITGVTGYSKAGNPIYDPATAKLRKEITAMYMRNYPGAKMSHKLKKRVVEGYATLLQKYVEQPTATTQNYPNIVREFLKPGGQFYEPVIGEILTDLRGIVEDYQRLAPLDKIGARVTSDLNPTGKESFLDPDEAVRTEMSDNIYPIEKLARLAGVEKSKNDPSLWLRQYNNHAALFANNVKGTKGYWAFKDLQEGFQKAIGKNWGDLMKGLEKSQEFDAFNNFLVARDQHFNFQELALRNTMMEQEFKEVMKIGIEEASRTVDSEGVNIIDKYKVAKKAYEDLKRVLDKNGFSAAEV